MWQFGCSSRILHRWLPPIVYHIGRSIVCRWSLQSLHCPCYRICIVINWKVLMCPSLSSLVALTACGSVQFWWCSCTIWSSACPSWILLTCGWICPQNVSVFSLVTCLSKAKKFSHAIPFSLKNSRNVALYRSQSSTADSSISILALKDAGALDCNMCLNSAHCCGRNSPMVSSAPTILQSQVRIRSAPSTLFSICIEIVTRKEQK